ncbi:hypothetical protein IQ243_28035 [Nostocales cyanobacterium LEGE 11386]|nr:hypothetical protein [Nostocales cyanobacterium LEGE 11386]
MQIDVASTLSIVLGLITLAGAIYRLAQVEANINSKIARLESTLLTVVDQTKDNLSDRLVSIEKKIDIHLTEYAEKKVFVEYRFNATDKLIEHKFNRLANWIKQITGFLNKESGFQIRDDQF